MYSQDQGMNCIHCFWLVDKKKDERMFVYICGPKMIMIYNAYNISRYIYVYYI